MFVYRVVFLTLMAIILQACSSSGVKSLNKDVLILDGQPELVTRNMVQYTTLNGSNLIIYSPSATLNKCIGSDLSESPSLYLSDVDFSNYMVCAEKRDECSYFFELRNRDVLKYKYLGSCSSFEMLFD